ncbi:MAG: hypothetical protein GXN99_01410 [Candidatus Nanohaloarchaeota archaeon]|nr:hypothetical protein [Candidatus Nanohaloarchaeota archaeon]
MSRKGMSSSIRLIATIIVLLVIGLALIVAATGSAKDFSTKSKNVITKILGGDSSTQSGELNNIIEDIKTQN